jgi:hypothetical protein
MASKFKAPKGIFSTSGLASPSAGWAQGQTA